MPSLWIYTKNMSQLYALSSHPYFFYPFYIQDFFFHKRDSSYYPLFFLPILSLTHSKLLSIQSSPLANENSVPLIMFTEFLIFRLEKEELCFSVESGSFNKIGSVVKNLPAVQEMQVCSLVRNNLEKGMAAHSSILSWRIPWTEDPGWLYSPRGRKESDMTEWLKNNKQQLYKYIYIQFLHEIVPFLVSSFFLWIHFLIFFLKFLTIVNWIIVDLQCCVSFAV